MSPRVLVQLLWIAWAVSWLLAARWSGVTRSRIPWRREIGHRGPYGIVRHPIYTGILVAVVAMAVVKGTALAMAGGALCVVALWWKARLEEQWLAGECGEEVYQAYRRRVPMLLPFGPRAH